MSSGIILLGVVKIDSFWNGFDSFEASKMTSVEAKDSVFHKAHVRQPTPRFKLRVLL